jgi:hypothetical protein
MAYLPKIFETSGTTPGRKQPGAALYFLRTSGGMFGICCPVDGVDNMIKLEAMTMAITAQILDIRLNRAKSTFPP